MNVEVDSDYNISVGEVVSKENIVRIGKEYVLEFKIGVEIINNTLVRVSKEKSLAGGDQFFRRIHQRAIALCSVFAYYFFCICVRKTIITPENFISNVENFSGVIVKTVVVFLKLAL